MESHKTQTINPATQAAYTSKGKSVLFILSICFFLVTLSFIILIRIPSSVSYKNVNSLSELNIDKVRYYVENQRIYLVFNLGSRTDTIRSVADFESFKWEADLFSGDSEYEIGRMPEFVASHENPKPSAIRNEKKNTGGNIASLEASVNILEGFSPNTTAQAYHKGGNIRGASSPEKLPVIEPDVLPKFSTGKKDLEMYIARNKRTPDQARIRKIKGTVSLRFMVNVDGRLSDMRILKGLGYGCDEEAIRLLKNMPPWKPAMKGNEAVSYYQNLDIKF